MKPQRARPNIVSVHLGPDAKARLDGACQQRGMTIKALLGRLIEWFVELDKTEQSIVLKQVEVADVNDLAALLQRRRVTPAGPLNRAAPPRRRSARPRPAQSGR